jgi:hypothetical protein
MARYWIGSGDGLWGSTSNWSDTSGGATGFSVPTASDDVIFDGNGNNPCTLNASARVCLSFTVDAGYTNTITHDQQLTVSGNVTLHSGYTIAGISQMVIAGTSTIMFGGQVWPNDMTFSLNTVTKSIGDDLVILGRLSVTGSNTINGALFTIRCNGFTNTSIISGTTTIVLTGASLISSATIEINLSFDGGNIDVGSFNLRASTITYINGIITVTGTFGNLGSNTIDTNGILWNNVSFGTGTSTITLLSDFVALGTTTLTVNFSLNGSSFTYSTNGLTVNGQLSGTAEIILTGGTWSGTNTTGIANNLTIRPDNSIVTVSGSVYYRTGTLKYTASTYGVTTTASNLRFTGSSTVNTNGITWNNVFLQAVGQTLTLTSDMTCLGSTTCSISSSINKTVSEKWRTNGLSTSSQLGGTGEIILTGGTWESTGTLARAVVCDLTINGNVSVVGSVFFGTLSRVLKFDNTGGPYTVTTTGSTLFVAPEFTFDTYGIAWNNISLYATGGIITVNSLIVANSIDLGAISMSFLGTGGFETNNLICNHISALTITLQNSVTYQINEQFLCRSSRVGSIVLFTSNHASLRANLLMPNNGNNTCNVLASFTRIDASGGRSINTFGGTVTDCININQYYDYKPVAA